MKAKDYTASLDPVYPPVGPCLLCGGSDKRHRVADAVASSVRAGMTAQEIVAEYEGSFDLDEDKVLILAAWGMGGFGSEDDE